MYRAGFFSGEWFRKNHRQARTTKNAQKGPKSSCCFLLFKKIKSAVLSGILVKKNSHGRLAFCENCIPGKNLVLNFWPKMAPDQCDFSIL